MLHIFIGKSKPESRVPFWQPAESVGDGAKMPTLHSPNHLKVRRGNRNGSSPTPVIRASQQESGRTEYSSKIESKNNTDTNQQATKKVRD